VDHIYEAIPGWFAAEAVYRAAVAHFGDGARFVEVGAWKGRSAAFMAVEIANSGKSIAFTAIDHFKGSDEPAHRGDADVVAGTLEDACRRNLAPLAELVTIVRGESVGAAGRFVDGSLDFVFLDASHDEASVAADIAAWRPKLRAGGVLAGDDLQLPGVREAVCAAFGAAWWPVGRCWVVPPDDRARASFVGFTSLMMATPCFGGMVTNAYLMSMLRTSVALTGRRVAHEVVTSPGDSLISRARNSLVAVFLASAHSHLLFIDADIEWEPAAVLRLLRADKDLICGAYPKKKLPETYAINFKPDAHQQVRQCAISGAIEIMDAATGFLMIHRRALERLVAAHPELHYTGTASLTAEQERHSYALFDCMIDGGRYLSEDYGFCRRWQRLGGEVWLDPTIRLNHHGGYAYQGDVEKLFAPSPEHLQSAAE